MRMGIEGSKCRFGSRLFSHIPNPKAQSDNQPIRFENTDMRCTPGAYHPQQREAPRRYLEAITPERLDPSLHLFLESIYQLAVTIAARHAELPLVHFYWCCFCDNRNIVSDRCIFKWPIHAVREQGLTASDFRREDPAG